ncbi:MAG TPA: hypothetical protein VKU42_07235, partial [Candidatus Angelobacter sp.]|nr:hypothetical protein [Candidatus Angelobacter sp.]
MGGYYSLPQLQIPNFGAALRNAVELRSLLNAQKSQKQMAPAQVQLLQEQLKAAQMENQQRALQMKRDQALADLYQRGAQPGSAQTGNDSGPNNAGGTNPQFPQYQPPTDNDILRVAGPYGVPLLKGMKDLQKTNADLQEAQSKHQAAAQDYMGNLAYAIKNSGYDMGATRTLLQHAAGSGFGNEVAGLWSQISQNPPMLRSAVDQVIASSPRQRELAAQETTANARKQQADVAATKAGLNV